MSVTIAPIQTLYRGYRFRSRLEARWAVFFDAAGIKWQHEPDGYRLNDRSYLPDFYLPDFNIFVEIKPTEEECNRAVPLMEELVTKTDKRGLVIGGSPSRHEPYTAVNVWLSDETEVRSRLCDQAWVHCIFCGSICPHVAAECCYNKSRGHTLHNHHRRNPVRRVNFALDQAQRARFEHGEDGRPGPYPLPKKREDVYVAGSVVEEVKEEMPSDFDLTVPDYYCYTAIIRWRHDIFGVRHIFRADGKLSDGRFYYAGPTIIEPNHGDAIEGLADNCLTEIEEADVLFAWIDTPDTIGTIAEIGAAYAFSKPIFIAFATEELSRHFYFPRQLSTVAIVVPDAVSAWRVFKNWRNS